MLILHYKTPSKTRLGICFIEANDLFNRSLETNFHLLNALLQSNPAFSAAKRINKLLLGQFVRFS